MADPDRDTGARADKALWPPVDPMQAGLRGRCPRCGEGRLFDGFLKPAKACCVCRLDFSFIDSGDGPAVFVILIAGFLAVGIGLWLQSLFAMPVWLLLLVLTPLTVVLCLGGLRIAKGLLITYQYANKAAEGRLDS